MLKNIPSDGPYLCECECVVSIHAETEARNLRGTYLQKRNRFTDFEKSMVTKGDGLGRRGWWIGVWDWHMHNCGIWNDWPMGICYMTQRTLPNIL